MLSSGTLRAERSRLEPILRAKHEEIALLRKRKFSREPRRDVRGFVRALATKAQHERAIVCEIKRASPSAGVLPVSRSVADSARLAEAGFAACLSVTTDRRWFQGSAEDVALARAACHLPILRKDFVLDEVQVYESSAMGADCILLIMRALETSQARDLEACAHSLGLEVLVEVHEEAELARAVEHLRAPLIGVNSRDLRTLRTDIERAGRLLASVPADRFALAESGISSCEDMRVFARDVDHPHRVGFLIGEHLVRAESLQDALAELRACPLP